MQTKDSSTLPFWLAILALIGINVFLGYRLVGGMGQVPHPGKDHGRHHQQHPPKDHPAGEGPKYIIIERLGLDSAQVQAYNLLVEDHRAKMRTLTRKINQTNARLYSSLGGTLLPEGQAKVIMDSVGQLQIQKVAVNMAHFRDIKALCRPDQQAAFADLAQDLNELFSPRPRRPHPRGEGPERPEPPAGPHPSN
jgi:periplasmic protein CpxP/Spy